MVSCHMSKNVENHGKKCMRNLIILALLLPITAHALTLEQKHAQETAQEVWSAFDLPETGQAIAEAESSYREHQVADKDKAHASYGLCGVTWPAAQDVLKRNPDLMPGYTRDTVIGALIYRPRFNAMIAALYFQHLMAVTHNWRDAVRAYNAGITGMRHGFGRSYLERIRKIILSRRK